MDNDGFPKNFRLFRSSRPDYIETWVMQWLLLGLVSDCSGLPDRATLRPKGGRGMKLQPDIVPVFQTGLH